ncbi:hypothetical protein [Mycolicibacterium phlei]
MAVTTVYSRAALRNMPWWSIAAGAAALARGELIVLHHGQHIVLVGCADTTTTTQMAFIARYSAGRPRIAIHLDDADPVNVPAEVADVTHGGGTPAEIALALTDAALPRSSGAVLADVDRYRISAGATAIADAEAFASRHGLTLVAAPD